MEHIKHSNVTTIHRGGKVFAGQGSEAEETELVYQNDYDRHDLSHSFKTTGKMGMLLPCLSLTLNTGDSLKANCNFTQRFQPLLSPIMSSIETHVHNFFMPMDVLDFGWKMFNTGGSDGSYNRPLLHFNSVGLTTGIDNQLSDLSKIAARSVDGFSLYGVNSLLQMFDYPLEYGVTEQKTVRFTYIGGIFTPSRLIAYSRIYNEKYRVPLLEVDEWTDQHQLNYNSVFTTCSGLLSGAIQGSKSLSDFVASIRSEMPAGWMDLGLHLLTDPQYNFVSSLTSVYYKYADNELLLGSMLENYIDASEGSFKTGANTTNNFDNFLFAWTINLMFGRTAPWERSRETLSLPFLQRGTFERLMLPVLTSHNNGANTLGVNTAGGPLSYYDEGGKVLGYQLGYGSGKSSNVYTTMSMNDLREMSAVTRFLELSARVGYKWDEWLKAFFGIQEKVHDPYEPVYIGGAKSNANVDSITCTADTEQANIGDFTGQAISGTSSDTMTINCPETGVVIGLFYSKPRQLFLGGYDRNNCKFADKFLYWFKEFEHLQEQPLFASEFGANLEHQDFECLNGNSDDLVNSTIIGYEPRYQEFKCHKSHIGGELLSNLQYWTCARSFMTLGESVKNNYDFQHVNPTDEAVNRIFQVDSVLADNFIVSFGWNIHVLSMLSTNTEPNNKL